MSKRTPKTLGLEWLYHSMNAFNGSGYADKESAKTYVLSYKAYKTWKKQKYALEVLAIYPEEAFQLASKLIYARPAGHIPSTKNMAKFEKIYERELLGLI